MTTATNPASFGASARVILAAAILDRRYLNPEAAAFNRMRRAQRAGSLRRAGFWLTVLDALTAGDLAVRRAVNARAAAIDAAQGAA